MPQVVKCQHCESRFSASDRLAGKRVACKSCGEPIEVPTSALADLLDDELQLQSNKNVIEATVVTPSGPHCIRCRSSLAAGERFCVACGHHNFNGAETVAKGQIEKMNAEIKSHEQNKKLGLALRPTPLGLIRYLLDD